MDDVSSVCCNYYEFSPVAADRRRTDRYRYQLEAFVDMVRGRSPVTWLSEDNSVADMEWIERVYEKVRCALIAFHGCPCADAGFHSSDWSR